MTLTVVFKALTVPTIASLLSCFGVSVSVELHFLASSKDGVLLFEYPDFVWSDLAELVVLAVHAVAVNTSKSIPQALAVQL